MQQAQDTGSRMQTINDDERIRDHLANERTYLAWLRTGLSTMGFGVVIAKLRFLFPAEELTSPSANVIHASNIGFFFAIVGLFIVMIAGWRYAVVQDQIRRKSYRSSKRIVIALSFCVIALGMMIVWYLLQG